MNKIFDIYGTYIMLTAVFLALTLGEIKVAKERKKD
jgi:hypothetical protein